MTGARQAPDVPARIEVVENPDTIARLLPFVHDMVGDGLIEVIDTTVVNCVRPPGLEPRMAPPHVRLWGPSKLLRVSIGENDDAEETIRKAIAALDEMIPAGLVALSDVEVIEYRASTDWTEEPGSAT